MLTPPNDDRVVLHGANEQDPYYILAAHPLADERSRVLKHGDTFAVFDHYGDVRPVGLCEQGLYHGGTRFLSRSQLALGRNRPLILSSTITEANDLLTVDLTNPDITGAGEVSVPRGSLHLFRVKFLWHGVCYERVRIKNYGLIPVEVVISIYFSADFVDIFEVRGTHRSRRGEQLNPLVENGHVVLGYRGLDGVVRRTRLNFAPHPEALSATQATYVLTLAPTAEANLDMNVVCEMDVKSRPVLSFPQAIEHASGALKDTPLRSCLIQSSKQHFNDWINRAVADLHMMITETDSGPYPYAGVPWFSTPFGRDGIITALECLWLCPCLARGVLAYLAATQATASNPEQDAEPGKILHETRRGEMAALGEIPFGRYYGSVDATPLFVILAGAYYERTADRTFVESMWPHVEAALNWVDRYGDIDGDGFVEYARRSETGLVNQGWKDSHDALFHADGRLAEGPIALAEVQGYVFAAKRAAALMADALGLPQRANELQRQAKILCERFEDKFWCEELGTYALALDGAKQACRVRASNAGHCLSAGIVSKKRAASVAQNLLDPHFFSGWGVRTVSANELRYNPMSYHNGSIWPHDNALIAWGLARYGRKDECQRIMSALFDAALFFEMRRLPELFCGFTRRAGEGPTLYPVACAPQAWSAAAVFLLLQACLGLRISAPSRRLSFSHAVLPPFLKELRLHNLQVGQASVDLLLLRHDHDVGLTVLRRTGDLEISMIK